MKYVTLNTEQKMPAVGLGTWKSAPGEVYQAVRWALKLGYTHFDCAQIYGNQKEIGMALKDAFSEDGIKRQDLFITSKLWNDAHKVENVMPAIKTILSELQLDYVDLLLMHWPIAQKPGTGIPHNAEDMVSLADAPLSLTWAEMEKAYNQGLVKALGSSNFGIKKLTQLIENAMVSPAVNQVESHPYWQQWDLLEFCRKNNIVLTAYSPLGSMDRQYKKADEPLLADNEVIKEIARKNNLVPQQVMLAWQVNRGVVVIPKSVKEGHMRQNLAASVIELDADDMKKIADIKEQYRFIGAESFAYGNYTSENIFE